VAVIVTVRFVTVGVATGGVTFTEDSDEEHPVSAAIGKRSAQSRSDANRLKRFLRKPLSKRGNNAAMAIVRPVPFHSVSCFESAERIEPVLSRTDTCWVWPPASVTDEGLNTMFNPELDKDDDKVMAP